MLLTREVPICETSAACSLVSRLCAAAHEVSGGGHVVHCEGQGATAPALLGGAEELLLDGHLACDLPGLAGGDALAVAWVRRAWLRWRWPRSPSSSSCGSRQRCDFLLKVVFSGFPV